MVSGAELSDTLSEELGTLIDKISDQDKRTTMDIPFGKWQLAEMHVVALQKARITPTRFF